jgi:hypothetical protein
MKPLIKKTRGPVLLIPNRDIHVGVSKYTKMTQFGGTKQMFGDLYACIAALPMAVQNNASEIVLEVEGERPRRHKVKDAVRHLEADPIRLAPYLNGFGNVEDPKFGLNLAPGNHHSSLQFMVDKVQARQRKRAKSHLLIA